MFNLIITKVANLACHLVWFFTRLDHKWKSYHKVFSGWNKARPCRALLETPTYLCLSYLFVWKRLQPPRPSWVPKSTFKLLVREDKNAERRRSIRERTSAAIKAGFTQKGIYLTMYLCTLFTGAKAQLPKWRMVII